MIARLLCLGLGAVLGACAPGGLPRQVANPQEIAPGAEPTNLSGSTDLALKLPQDYYGIAGPDDPYFRGARSFGAQSSVVDERYTTGLGLYLDLHSGIPNLLNTEARFQGMVDIDSERVDSERSNEWYVAQLHADGPLYRFDSSEESGSVSLIWSAGFDVEKNTTYTEKSYLTAVGLGTRWKLENTSLTAVVGTGHYEWEADDEVPFLAFQRRDGLEVDDKGLHINAELVHRFDNGITLRNDGKVQFQGSSSVREVRISANVEVPFHSILDRVPNSLRRSHILLIGEYREFDMDQRILPFRSEGRIGLAFGSTF